ncbi:MAG: thiol-disulfide oxidoreductase DCC family protein [Chitinophagaceae bacterium]|nr:thiol-disulfide oxidoreductase DCC family protein [Chitinophagaceae bacterium]MCW5928112.1 thiol-disulfide oxidoreductase DCC family protein [Chitinophagaceae bacterium]
MADYKALILFDGTCNLCQGSVQFVLKREKAPYYSFASLQSSTGQQVLQQYHLPQDSFRSFVLVENGKAYIQSTAALKVTRKLRGGWSLLYGLMIIPAFIRNAVYNIIARNRHKWFGKTESCMLPTPELKGRFLD